jgi:hypothetical protein
MGKRSRRRQREAQSRLLSSSSAPTMTIAIAALPATGVSLASEVALLKPALLYGDRVILYSPAASMLAGFASLAHGSDLHYLELITQLATDPPKGESWGGVTPGLSGQLQQFQQLLRARGSTPGVQRLRHQVREQLRPVMDQMQALVEEQLEQAGAGELVPALEAGLLDVNTVGIETGSAEAMVDAFVARITELLCDAGAFPLFDQSVTGLVRAMINEGRLTPNTLALSHSTEAATASGLLAHLPSFPGATIAEILDIREEIRSRLIGFRAAMVELSSTFAQQPFDEDFAAAVTDAWRTKVEPALQELQRHLADHRFLAQFGNAAAADIRRLIVEGAGVFFGLSSWTDVSALIHAAATAAVPLADVAARAGREVAAGRREATSHKFYFLHSVEEALRKAS